MFVANSASRQTHIAPFRKGSVALAVVLAVLVWGQVPLMAQNRAADPRANEELSFSLEILDAQAFQPQTNQTLAYPGYSDVIGNPTRTGAFADGASVLVIRLSPLWWSEWNTTPVTFTIAATAGTAANDGMPDCIGSISAAFPSLPAPDTGPGLGDVVVTIAANSPKVVYYRPPNNFLFGVGSASSAPYYGTITVTATGIPGPPVTKDISVVRPTLFLNHGINSSPSTWSAFGHDIDGSGLTGSLRVLLVNWSNMNSSGFDEITPVLVSSVSREITYQQALNGIAATRVDVCGHSAGGEMVKFWAADFGAGGLPRPAGWPAFSSAGNPYKTASTFGLGGIRRFVSIGSPFRGSLWSDFIVLNFSYPIVSAGAGLVMTGDETLIADLGELSSFTGLTAPTRPQISWFPIVGIAQPKPFDALGGGTLGQLILKLIILPEYWAGQLGFNSGNSDWVVQWPSQVDSPHPGTLPGTNAMIGNDTHNDETSDVGVWQEVMKSIDLYQGGAGGYGPGYTLFNSNL